MFGTYFYHQKVRKSVAAFGSLFTRLHVIRKDKSGNVISTVKVPLSYAPRSKYLERISGTNDLQRDESVALKLPRMAFEMTSIIYDETRQLPKRNLQIIQTTDNSNTKRAKITPQVPYNLTFSLTIFATAQDDALQIVEQILPYFTPQYSLTLKPFKGDYDDILEDAPITLQSVAYLSDYEGKHLQDVTKGELDLGEIAPSDEDIFKEVADFDEDGVINLDDFRKILTYKPGEDQDNVIEGDEPVEEME